MTQQASELACPWGCHKGHHCGSSVRERNIDIRRQGYRAHVHYDGCGRTFYETEHGNIRRLSELEREYSID